MEQEPVCAVGIADIASIRTGREFQNRHTRKMIWRITADRSIRLQGILSGVLAEIRANAANELADDTARYEEELKAHYEAEMKEKQEAFEKEKEDLITLFENPDLPGTTPEGESKPDLGGEPEPDPEEKTVIEKKYIGGETVVEEVE